MIDEFSWEAKTSPAIEKAVQEEFQGLLDMGAISLGDVREWADVIRADPKAKHARMRFVLGQKNAELEEAKRRIKARMVVGGHDVRDASGQRCVDVLHHIVPVGMTSIRLCHAHAASCVDGITKEADIVQAYPKAPLGGDPVWVSLPKRVMPAAWQAMTKPVVPLKRTLYGLQRAGFDFGIWLREILLSKAWRWIRDIGDTSLYVRGSVLLAVYTDDLKFAGPRTEVESAFHELHKLVGFSAKSLTGESDAAFIGIEAENWSAIEGTAGLNVVRLHQTAYATHVVRGFEATVEHRIKISKTPEKYRRDAEDAALAEIPGMFTETAAAYVGQLLWLARGTRPDIAHAVQRLSTRVSKWSCEEDKALYHLMQYLKGSVNRSIWYSIDPEEVARGTVVLHGRADSDHAGEATSARSTSGWRLALEGTRTFALLDWGSRRQGGTAKSTPEAELLAIGDLITRSLAPVGEAISQAWGRQLFEAAETDNDAALTDVLSGHSKKMAYVRHYQKLSIGLVHDYFDEENREIGRVDTTDNDSDMFTKPLDVEAFERHCATLYIV